MQSLREFASSFADKQALERLKQCGEIEDALNECEKIRKLMKSKGDTGMSQDYTRKINIQDTRAGMKIARFYDWGLINPRAQEAVAAMRGDGGLRTLHPTVTDGKDTSRKDIKTKAVSTEKVNSSSAPALCHREKHAVWGCRAMALGCANDLVKLKKCMLVRHNHTNPKYSTYESEKDWMIADGCQLEMQKLGRCVSTNWKELSERLK